MIKTCCNFCGLEITDKNDMTGNIRLSTGMRVEGHTEPVVKVEITVIKNHDWTDGDFCKYCIFDAIYKLDDRPKEGENMQIKNPLPFETY